MKPSDMKKHDGKSFTRKRLLTMWRIITIILRSSPNALQIRLDEYYAEIGCKEEVVSKQAFSKARGKLDPEIIRVSFELTTKTMVKCEDF